MYFITLKKQLFFLSIIICTNKMLFYDNYEQKCRLVTMFSFQINQLTFFRVKVCILVALTGKILRHSQRNNSVDVQDACLHKSIDK
ncbi:hypothetical protein VK86_02820 [Moellerella wisconsensis]|nr:hypothetical protein VK86_02820 [Moellerella wisconsensis]